MNTDRITELIIKHLNGELTEADRHELEDWMAQSQDNRGIANEFIDDNKTKEVLLDVMSKGNVWSKIELHTGDARVIWLRRRSFKWIAAAVMVFVVGGLWYLTQRRNDATENKEVAVNHDVKAPISNRAMITLADGRKVYLDSAGNGMLASEGGVKVLKNGEGEVVYQSTDDGPLSTVAYNTLYNPRGSKVISLTLADGSKVWLNAESSLRYPTAFVGGERKVEITGEAYFEVAHNAEKPFFVGKGDVSVQVLGTHFNVNTYNDEDAVRVTLLEGKVQVSTSNESNKSIVLKPGQQAVAINNGQLTVNNNPDVDKVMAWREGFFQFEDASIQEITRQLARWYDITVVFEGNPVQRKLGGRINRGQSLSSVLKAFEAKDIHFAIEGKKLVVKQ